MKKIIRSVLAVLAGSMTIGITALGSDYLLGLLIPAAFQNNGKMPAWNQLSDVEIASVITYTRNGWTNSGKGTDPIVQPADVTADRKK